MYRICSDHVFTRWYPTPDQAWEAFCRACRRRGFQAPLHRPGVVAGDLHEPRRSQGVRYGHGMVYLESR